ncbi:MAG TPA: hypothetical protein PLZ57_06310 [Pseudobdellovibrionaceae bacterium]|nr:hypothetical protein [Pseudobdellovibrionaceae bacterium]
MLIEKCNLSNFREDKSRVNRNPSTGASRSTHRNLVVLALAIFALSLPACSQKQGDQSQVKIQLPDWQALKVKSAEQMLATQKSSKATASNKSLSDVSSQSLAAGMSVTRVMINMSGAGLPSKIIKVWDAHDRTGLQPPSFFEFSVPKSVSVLTQVMIIVEPTGGGGMSIYYGDQLKTFTNSIEDLTITVNSIGSGFQTEGRLYGRYITTGGTGPTGELGIHFRPPDGKPEMVLDTTPIYNGYFQSFITASANFSYRITRGPDAGLTLFEDVNATSASLSAIGQESSLYAFVPQGYRTQEGGAIVTALETHAITGFFGPGASSATHKACYDSNSGTLSYRYIDSAATTQITWSPNSSTASHARILRGGRAQSSCGSFDENITKFTLNKNRIGDSAPYYGAFQTTTSSSGTLIEVTTSGSSATVSWNYLPGVIATSAQPTRGVSGVRLLSRIKDANSISYSRSPSCGELIDVGFQERMTIPAGSDTTPTESISVTLNSAEQSAASSSNLEVALCPYNDNVAGYLPGPITNKHNEGGGGCQFCLPQATQIKLTRADHTTTSASAPLALRNETCVGVWLKAETSSGQPGSYYNPVSLTASSGLMLSQSSNCMGSGSSLSVHPYQSMGYFYIHSSSSAGTGTITANTGSSVVSGSSFYVAHTTGTATPDQYRVYGPTDPTIYAHSCYPVSIQTYSSAGNFATMSSAGSETIFLPTVTSASQSVQWWSDPTCTSGSALSSVNLYGSGGSGTPMTTSTLYMKYTGTGASGSETLVFSNSSGSNLPAQSNLTFSVAQPGAPAVFQLSINNNIPSEYCQFSELLLLDSSGRPTTSGSSFSPTFTLSRSGSSADGFYPSWDSNCTSGSASLAVTFGSSDSRLRRSFKFTGSSGSLGLTIAGLPSGVSASNYNFTITPAAAAFVLAQVTGQSATVTGSCAWYTDHVGNYPNNSQISLQLKAVTASGNLVTDFNMTDLSQSSSGFGLRTGNSSTTSITGCSVPTWSGGMANINCTVSATLGSGVLSEYLSIVTGGGGTSFYSVYNSNGFIGRDTSLSSGFDRALVSAPTVALDGTTGTCQPVLAPLSFWDGSAARYAGPAAGSTSTTISAGSVTIFQNSNCTTSLSSINYAAGESDKVVYLTGSSTMPWAPIMISGASGNFVTTGSSATPIVTTESSANLTGTPASGYALVTLPRVKAGSCLPMLIYAKNSYGYAMPLPTDSLSMNTSSGVWFTNNKCSGPAQGTINTNAGQRSQVLYWKPTTTGSSLNVQFSGGSWMGSTLIWVDN